MCHRYHAAMSRGSPRRGAHRKYRTAEAEWLRQKRHGHRPKNGALASVINCVRHVVDIAGGPQ